MNTPNKNIILILMLGAVAISPTALLSMKRKRVDSSQSNSSQEEKDHSKKKRKIEEKPLYELLAQERFQGSSYYKNLSTEEFAKESKTIIEEYKGYEENLESLKKNPLLSIWGGINCAMTIDEMKQVAQEKFKAMKKNGSLFLRLTLKKLKTITMYHILIFVEYGELII